VFLRAATRTLERDAAESAIREMDAKDTLWPLRIKVRALGCAEVGAACATSVREKGSHGVQIGLFKPKSACERERRANIRTTPRVPARYRRLPSGQAK
jgi:hypothetical protein